MEKITRVTFDIRPELSFKIEAQDYAILVKGYYLHDSLGNAKLISDIRYCVSDNEILRFPGTKMRNIDLSDWKKIHGVIYVDWIIANISYILRIIKTQIEKDSTPYVLLAMAEAFSLDKPPRIEFLLQRPDKKFVLFTASKDNEQGLDNPSSTSFTSVYDTCKQIWNFSVGERFALQVHVDAKFSTSFPEYLKKINNKCSFSWIAHEKIPYSQE